MGLCMDAEIISTICWDWAKIINALNKTKVKSNQNKAKKESKRNLPRIKWLMKPLSNLLCNPNLLRKLKAKKKRKAM